MPLTNLEDTITAISTPLGEGGIGIVRLSGRNSIAIAESLFRPPAGRAPSSTSSHSLIYGNIVDPESGSSVDEVLITTMRKPHTYTREDMAEINCHGGITPVRRVLELTIREGARLAEPGEFTFRAFMNGRIDLSQAEATIDLIRAKTEKSSRIALEQLSGELAVRIKGIKDAIFETCAHIEAHIDFPEEDIDLQEFKTLRERVDRAVSSLMDISSSYEEGRFYREGISTAIIGRPNVGKSSLMNALLERERAIVTELPGTTRDLIEEYLSINGLPVRIIDTAGIREAHDLAESEGVKRSLRAIENADLILAIFDISSPLNDEDMKIIEKISERKAIAVLNKADLPSHPGGHNFPEGLPVINISARRPEGLDQLKNEIEKAVIRGVPGSDGLIITNLRHKVAIDNAADALKRASSAMSMGLPLEISALELRQGLDSMGEITGEVTTDDILNKIFSEFCIGK